MYKPVYTKSPLQAPPEQYQSVGSGFINELKNILITVLSAKLVIDGQIIGMMLAISYIVGAQWAYLPNHQLYSGTRRQTLPRSYLRNSPQR